MALPPKTVFLLDGLGAALSAVLLTAVLTICDAFFGMPQETLIVLSVLASTLAVYSLSCFAFAGNNARKLLPPLIVGNSAYGLLTLGLVSYHNDTLTIWGLAYFLGEVMVLCGLIYVERKTLYASNTRNDGEVRGEETTDR